MKKVEQEKEESKTTVYEEVWVETEECTSCKDCIDALPSVFKYNEDKQIDGALGATHMKAQATLKNRSEGLKNVKIPTLVMHGEEDYAVDKYGGIQTAASIENAELVLIPKNGTSSI